MDRLVTTTPNFILTYFQVTLRDILETTIFCMKRTKFHGFEKMFKKLHYNQKKTSSSPWLKQQIRNAKGNFEYAVASKIIGTFLDMMMQDLIHEKDTFYFIRGGKKVFNIRIGLRTWKRDDKPAWWPNYSIVFKRDRGAFPWVLTYYGFLTERLQLEVDEYIEKGMKF